MICESCKQRIDLDEIIVWDYDDHLGGQGERRHFCGNCKEELYPTDDDWRKVYDDWQEDA